MQALQTRQSVGQVRSLGGQKVSGKENPGVAPGKGQLGLQNPQKSQRRFGEDLTNRTANPRQLGPTKPVLRETKKAEVKAVAAAAPSTKKSAKKVIVPEMEYAYFDESKASYKDSIVESMDFQALMRMTPQVEERPLDIEEIPHGFTIDQNIASLLLGISFSFSSPTASSLVSSHQEDDLQMPPELGLDLDLDLDGSVSFEPIQFDTAAF